MTTYSYGQLESLWINAEGPTAVAPLMAAIAMAESGGESTAENPSGASGLWQILGAVDSSDQSHLMDPETNAKEAVLKYKSQGLNAWVTYTSGAYKKYLKSGVAPADTPQGSTPPASTAESLGGGLLGLPSSIGSFFSDADKIVTGLMWLTQPSSWVRIGAFLAGVALLLIGIHALLAVGEGGNIMPKAPTIVPIPV